MAHDILAYVQGVPVANVPPAIVVSVLVTSPLKSDIQWNDPVDIIYSYTRAVPVNAAHGHEMQYEDGDPTVRIRVARLAMLTCRRSLPRLYICGECGKAGR